MQEHRLQPSKVRAANNSHSVCIQDNLDSKKGAPILNFENIVIKKSFSVWRLERFYEIAGSCKLFLIVVGLYRYGAWSHIWAVHAHSIVINLRDKMLL